MTETAEIAEASQGRTAYARLLDEIRRGALPPGARLRESELAERLGISRTPVREAIRMLESDGLVVHAPRAGATVRRLDHAEVVELYEMRAVLEGAAARMAARAASEAEIAELAALNAEIATAPDAAAAYELNRQFHRMLLDAAKNRYLARSMSAMEKTLAILGPTTLTDPCRAEQAVAEHARVLAALTARDGAMAEAEMRVHIEAAHRVRLRGLSLRERGAEN